MNADAAVEGGEAAQHEVYVGISTFLRRDGFFSLRGFWRRWAKKAKRGRDSFICRAKNESE